MKLSGLHIIIFLLLSAPAWGQVQSIKINDIQLTGLVKNNEEYIQKFLTLSKGESLSEVGLEAVRQQLIRRTGVSNVIIDIDTIAPGLANLTFEIEEQKTLRPQLGIGRIKGNFWWQVGLAEYNLGGKEKTLIGTYLQNDKQPNFQIFYQNNRVKGGSWGYSLDVNRQSSIEPLYFPESTVVYKYANLGAGLSLTYNLDFNRRVLIGSNLFQEQYDKDNPDDIGVSDGPDELTENKLLFKAQYEDNHLNYDYFYRIGYQYNILVQSVNNIDVNSQFHTVSFEGKRFWRPSTLGNIAIRLRAALATNTPSPFAPFVLDSKVNLRGSGNRVDRGTAQLVLNLEYRQTLFHSDKFAGQIIGFADLGTWRNPGGELKDLFNSDLFREFIGLGVRFINKKVFQSTLRLDYGIDVANTNQRGFVFGVGQYF